MDLNNQDMNDIFNTKLTSHGFKNLYSDPCVHIWTGPDDTQIITVWVDDLLIFTIAVESMANLKCEISEMFEVTDLSEPNKIVSIKISRNWEKKSISITQSTYIDAILHKYGMQDINPIKTPMDSNLKLEPGELEARDWNNNYASLDVCSCCH